MNTIYVLIEDVLLCPLRRYELGRIILIQNRAHWFRNSRFNKSVIKYFIMHIKITKTTSSLSKKKRYGWSSQFQMWTPYSLLVA